MKLIFSGHCLIFFIQNGLLYNISDDCHLWITENVSNVLVGNMIFMLFLLILSTAHKIV